MKPKLTRYEVRFTLSNYGAGKFWRAHKNGTHVRYIRAANKKEAFEKVMKRLTPKIKRSLRAERVCPEDGHPWEFPSGW